MLLFICMCFAFNFIRLNGAETNAPQRKATLDGILKQLNRKPTEAEQWMGDRAAWYDTNAHKTLADFITQNPNTEEALTAELWLAWVETAASQTADSPAHRSTMRGQAAAFKKIITQAPKSWQARLARIGRCTALLHARLWDEFHKAADETLASIGECMEEKNKDFNYFIETLGIPCSEMEPEFRDLLVTAACVEGKLDKALQYAEELQSKFPDWSKRNHIARDIEALKRGESPRGL